MLTTYLMKVTNEYEDKYDPEKFKTLSLPENKEAEELVEVYEKWFKDRDIEIFNIEGRQFITEHGIYMIMTEAEIKTMKFVDKAEDYEERTITKDNPQ